VTTKSRHLHLFSRLAYETFRQTDSVSPFRISSKESIIVPNGNNRSINNRRFLATDLQLHCLFVFIYTTEYNYCVSSETYSQQMEEAFSSVLLD
jgi:hypothetical protein